MIFDNASLSEAVSKALAESNIPDDHRNALVLVATTSGEVKAVLSTKIGGDWQMAGYVLIAPRNIEGGIRLQATW